LHNNSLSSRGKQVLSLKFSDNTTVYIYTLGIDLSIVLSTT
jgi:hypothetical protein